MKLVIREFMDDGGDGSNNRVSEVVVISLREDETRFIQTDEVEDIEEHWANGFNVWHYNLSEIKRLITDDQERRRYEWRTKHVAAEAAEAAGEAAW